jgi:hypothetical protein
MEEYQLPLFLLLKEAEMDILKAISLSTGKEQLYEAMENISFLTNPDSESSFIKLAVQKL